MLLTSLTLLNKEGKLNHIFQLKPLAKGFGVERLKKNLLRNDSYKLTFIADEDATDQRELSTANLRRALHVIENHSSLSGGGFGH